MAGTSFWQRCNIPKGIWALLGLVFLLGTFSLRHKGRTYDETSHYQYGVAMLNGNADRGQDDSKMPFAVLNALPQKIIKIIAPQALSETHLFMAGRLMTLLAHLALALLVFVWSRSWYGQKAGWFSFVLMLADPNLLAHGRLITTDTYTALMVCASLFTFWRFLQTPNLKTGALSALILGFAQLAKYTCAYLLPLFVLWACLHFRKSILSKEPEVWKRTTTSALRYTLLFVLLGTLIINIGFLGLGSGTPLGKYQLQSGLFKSLQRTPVIGSLPLPLPVPFIEGLDRVKANDETGLTYGNIYLNGILRADKGQGVSGFSGYFFWVGLFKTPLPLLVIWAVLLWHLIHDIQKQRFTQKDGYLLLPVAFFVIYFNFLFNSHIGIRYFLVVCPLLYIWAGRLLKDPAPLPAGMKKMFYAGGLVWVFSVGWCFPHLISYTNLLVPNKTQAYKHFADSNLDWGQNKWFLENHLKNHPKAQFNPSQPTPGHVVVSVNGLVGLFEPQRYAWLRNHFEPVDHVAHSYLVYDINPADLKELDIP